MQRFFLKPEDFNPDGAVTINDPSMLHQMRRVLRMEPGDSLILLDNTGSEFVCRVEKLGKEKAFLRIIEKKRSAGEPEIFVTLYQALPKKAELFEWVLQKGTEIGVSRFVPVVTDRTERRALPRRERLEKILQEAAEQSERGKIPEIGEIQKFTEAVAGCRGSQKILLHGRGSPPLLAAAALARESSVDLFIGPEGGFAESELRQALEKGVTVCSLGPRVLRTETAGIAAASLVLL